MSSHTVSYMDTERARKEKKLQRLRNQKREMEAQASRDRQRYQDQENRMNTIAEKTKQQNNKIKQMSRQMQNVEKNLSHQMDAERARRENELQRLRNQQREMEAQASRDRQRYRDQANRMDAIDERTKQMGRQIQNVEKNLSHQIENTRSELKSDINRLDIKVDNVRKSLESSITQLRDEIENRETNKRTIASMLLKDAEDSLAMVATYKHEKFKPRAYNELDVRLDSIKQNFELGLYEATVANAQSLITDVYKLRVDLIFLEEEWNGYRQAAFDAGSHTLAACEANKIVDYAYEGEDGSEGQINVEIDYWSDGKFSHIEEQAKQQLEELEDDEKLTTEDLKNMIETTQANSDQLKDVIQDAQDRLILSQIRRDVGEDIEGSLYEEGYEIVDSAYEEEDPRKPLWIKYENANTKDEIVTIIKPREDLEIELQYHFLTSDDDESLLEQRAINIDRQISKSSGIQLQTTECKGSESTEHRKIEEMQNFESIRQPKKELGI